jgi:hypothetical protein
VQFTTSRYKTFTDQMANATGVSPHSRVVNDYAKRLSRNR